MVSIMSCMTKINEAEYQIMLKSFMKLATLNDSHSTSAVHMVGIIAENEWHLHFGGSWACSKDHADEHLLQAIMLIDGF